MADIQAIKAEQSVKSEPQEASSSFAGRLNISSFTFRAPESPSRPSPRVQSPVKQESSVAVVIPRAEIESPLPTPTSAPLPAPTLSPGRSQPESSSTTSASPRKRQRTGYAPPETYAHLNELTDIMAPNLIGIFVGLNPGLMTAAKGHAYSHPSNRFWHLLHVSGLTDRKLKPVEDTTLPERYQLGNTNLLARPTRNQGEVTKAEMDARVHILEEKVRKYRPECVIITGKSIWESIWRVRHGRPCRKTDFKYGWQVERMGSITRPEVIDGVKVEKWGGARLFVATSTSGLAATPSYPEKEIIWKEVGEWVQQRRRERTAANSGSNAASDNATSAGIEDRESMASSSEESVSSESSVASSSVAASRERAAASARAVANTESTVANADVVVISERAIARPGGALKTERAEASENIIVKSEVPAADADAVVKAENVVTARPTSVVKRETADLSPEAVVKRESATTTSSVAVKSERPAGSADAAVKRERSAASDAIFRRAAANRPVTKNLVVKKIVVKKEVELIELSD